MLFHSLFVDYTSEYNLFTIISKVCLWPVLSPFSTGWISMEKQFHVALYNFVV